jgi:hypothetical protein
VPRASRPEPAAYAAEEETKRDQEDLITRLLSVSLSLHISLSELC